MTTEDIVILNVTNQPSINVTGAVTKSVAVNGGAVLTIAAAGVLNINGSSQSAIANEGTVNNNGTIIIGAISSVGNFGIVNQSTINNNVGGIIRIDRATDKGIYNFDGTFTNAGTITIGATASVGLQGILNASAFNNNAGGTINIDRTTEIGIYNYPGASGTFTNAGVIALGAIADVGTWGIQNQAIFNNNAGGTIKIEGSTNTGLVQYGTFNNAATLTIGARWGVGKYGIQNHGIFHNIAGGTINIDRSTLFGLHNSSGIFTNEASVIIGATSSAGSYGIYNSATFNNNVGSSIIIDRSIISGIHNQSGTFTNAANITIGATTSAGSYGIQNNETFNNNVGGTINIDRSTTSGIYNAFGNFTNAATLTIGAISSVGVNGIDNSATFRNNTCTSVINILSNSILSNPGFFTNAGNIIENASGNSSISINTGTVQNLNGGTFTIGSGNAAVTTSGVLWTGCTSSNWNIASNWSTGVVPLTTENVTIQDVTNKPVLASDQTVNSLTLMGTTKIILEDYNLTVNTLIGGSSSSYIITDGAGRLTIKALSISSPTLFPIGASASSYDPLSIKPTNSVDFSAKVKATATASDFAGTIADFNKVAKRQWDITPTGTPAATVVTLTNGGTTYTPTTAKVGHFNYNTAGTWEELSATHSAGTWTTTTSSFSPFGVGDAGGFAAAVLPIELLTFSGKNTEGGNLLTWTTANEVNNKGFQIERAPQPPKGAFTTWESIGFVKAKGNAATYEFIDNQPLSTSYYRLRQIDNDGKETLSKVVSVSNNKTTKLKLYPSVTSGILTIETNTQGDFQIINLLGQQVIHGSVTPQINVSALPVGTYIIRVGEAQARFVKQ